MACCTTFNLASLYMAFFSLAHSKWPSATLVSKCGVRLLSLNVHGSDMVVIDLGVATTNGNVGALEDHGPYSSLSRRVIRMHGSTVCSSIVSHVRSWVEWTNSYLIKSNRLHSHYHHNWRTCFKHILLPTYQQAFAIDEYRNCCYPNPLHLIFTTKPNGANPRITGLHVGISFKNNLTLTTSTAMSFVGSSYLRVALNNCICNILRYVRLSCTSLVLNCMHFSLYISHMMAKLMSISL